MTTTRETTDDSKKFAFDQAFLEWQKDPNAIIKQNAIGKQIALLVRNLLNYNDPEEIKVEIEGAALARAFRMLYNNLYDPNRMDSSYVFFFINLRKFMYSLRGRKFSARYNRIFLADQLAESSDQCDECISLDFFDETLDVIDPDELRLAGGVALQQILSWSCEQGDQRNQLVFDAMQDFQYAGGSYAELKLILNFCDGIDQELALIDAAKIGYPSVNHEEKQRRSEMLWNLVRDRRAPKKIEPLLSGTETRKRWRTVFCTGYVCAPLRTPRKIRRTAELLGLKLVSGTLNGSKIYTLRVVR